MNSNGKLTSNKDSTKIVYIIKPHHLCNLNTKDLESAVTDIWEDYIPCLHKTLHYEKQLPEVYTQ
jgi:hypothetical protein